MVIFVLANFIVFAISSMLADLAMHDREPRRRVLAVLVAIPVVATGIVLALGTASWLSAPNAALCAAVLAAALFPFWWTSRKRRTAAPALADANTALADANTAPAGVLTELSAGFFAAFAGLYLVKTVVGPPGFWADCLVYHATVVAEWMREGSIGHIAPYQTYWPLSSEAFSCWTILPFARDGAAGYSGFYWVVVALAALFALVRNQGHRWPIALFTCGLFLASHCILRDAVRFSATDVAFAAMILAAVAFSTPSGATPTRRTKVLDGVYAGMAIGFAAGSKVLSLPAIGMLFLWFSFGQRNALGFRTRAIAVAAFSAVTAIVGAYWYARNWLVTGNPLFPAEFGPFDGPFTSAEQYRTKLLYWIFSHPDELLRQWRLLGRIANWGFGLGIVSLAGYLACLHSLCSGTGRRRMRDPAWWLPAAIGLLLLVVYPAVPFSGRIDNPDAPLTVSSRYITPSFGMGLVLYTTLLDHRSTRVTFWFSLAILGALTGWLNPYPQWTIPPRSLWIFVPIAAVVLALIGSTFARDLTGRIGRWASRPIASSVLVLLGLTTLALWEPAKQDVTDEHIFAFSMDANPRIGEAWRPIEDLPPGSRLAAFGPRTWMAYPLLGRRLQHFAVHVGEDGRKKRLLHERWSEEPFTWWEKAPAVPDPKTLVENLRESGADHVLVTRGDAPEWPPQQAALAASGGATTVYEDDITAIWKLTGE